jgi:Na+/phosphate symporter
MEGTSKKRKQRHVAYSNALIMFVGALVVMVVDQIFVDWMKKENSQTTNDE